MKRICMINGSPRGPKSGSQYFLDEIRRLLDPVQFRTEDFAIADCLKNGSVAQAFAAIDNADCLIFAFPLYIDSIPSHLLDFLHQLAAHRKSAQAAAPGAQLPRLYAVVNNGFIEGTQNSNALRIMRHFADAAGFTWRFGVGIGAGEFMKETGKTIPLQSKLKHKVYEALVKLKQDIENEEVTIEKNLLVNPAMPKVLFMMAGRHHWISDARKNRVAKKQLYARPWEAS